MVTAYNADDHATRPVTLKGFPVRKIALAAAALVMTAMSAGAFGANSSAPAGEPVVEMPTLMSLGCYWIVKGDDNANARVDVEYRKAGAAKWAKAMPLFRVEKQSKQKAAANRAQPVKVPDDSWMFAGSIVMLTPDTQYEVKLSLVDPDGGSAVKTFKSKTIAEPVAPNGMTQFHVAPGNGGGDGSAANPFKGLDEAQKHAAPGTMFIVHKGVYPPLAVAVGGQAGKPIIYRGAGDGEAIIDGGGAKGDAIDARGQSNLWFEKLTLRNASRGICLNDSADIVLRRCTIQKCPAGIWATGNKGGNVKGFFISDNVLEGTHPWSEPLHGAKVAEDRGMQITGAGHVICYNRVRDFKDGIDTFPSSQCVAIDIHNNDVSETLDDGSEMDFSDRNNRNFCNRYTNMHQGISVQPIFGGPVYIFRNALYNIQVEPFKMHNSPSGGVFIHNTIVKDKGPLLLYTPAEVHNIFYRNNLFVGRNASQGYDCDPQMVNCDMDYDGFAGGPFRNFLKFNRKSYRTAADARAGAPVYRHATVIDGDNIFAGGLRAPTDYLKQYDSKLNDLRLRPGTPAIDAGEALPNFSDGFSGKAPDLGAYELGAPLPQYGPRPEK